MAVVKSIIVPISTFNLQVKNLMAGSTYFISIAAHNGAGIGAFSTPVTQATISIPPSIPVNEFGTDTTRDITADAIPLLLPDIADLTAYR